MIKLSVQKPFQLMCTGKFELGYFYLNYHIPVSIFIYI